MIEIERTTQINVASRERVKWESNKSTPTRLKEAQQQRQHCQNKKLNVLKLTRPASEIKISANLKS